MCATLGKASKYAGGNLYNPQPTPDWQKGIGMFLSPGKPREKSGKENEAPTDEIEVMEIGEPSGASGSSTYGSIKNMKFLEICFNK